MADLALLLGVGLAAGWINTVAGGGSLLSVPALMWTGLPADIANGTSRVAIVGQGAVGVVGFRRAGRLDWGVLGRVVPTTLAGAVLGAYLATVIPNQVFKPVLIGTMMLMAVTLLLSPQTLAPPPDTEPLDVRQEPKAWVALFATGVYGGFLQAGVGLVLLAVLAGLLRHDLVRANALKVGVVLVYSVAALGVFVWRGKVAWDAGLVLAIGNMIGAQLGVHFAVQRGQQAIRWVVFGMVLVSCAALLWR